VNFDATVALLAFRSGMVSAGTLPVLAVPRKSVAADLPGNAQHAPKSKHRQA